MIEIGKTNTLKVKERFEDDVYLDGGESGKILLPKEYTTEKMKPGVEVEVFIYQNSKNRLVATTQKPYAEVDQYAYLTVAEVNDYGAFLDWGLPKELLVPFREQKPRMEAGKSYVVRVYLDYKTKRIVASSKIHKFLSPFASTYKIGEKVDLLIYQKTNMGYKAIINHQHSGLIYNNTIFKKIKVGEKMPGYIVNQREDGKIDISTNPLGYTKINDISERILIEIEKSGNRIEITDNSEPEVIYKRFGVSKKVFKKSIGMLYNKRLIKLTSNSIISIRNVEKPSE